MNTLIQTSIKRPRKDLLAKRFRSSVSALIVIALALGWFSPVVLMLSASTFSAALLPLRQSSPEGVGVVRDKNGKVNTVRYEAVNAMLLKEDRKVEAQQTKIRKQEATIAELKSTVARQQKGMEILTAQLKEQAAQIQKVSAQVGMSRPAPRVVANEP
jgi:septal ring factor EnvC (AmiA/AmiB activator)